MSAAATVVKEKRCVHCQGAIENLTLRGGRQAQRCTSCGRDVETVSANGTAAAPKGAACKVEGCPGRVDASGACPCCVKRARWVEEHTPKRFCEICGGEIQGTRNQKHCGACRPVRQRAAVAKSVEKSKKGGGRS